MNYLFAKIIFNYLLKRNAANSDKEVNRYDNFLHYKTTLCAYESKIDEFDE